jgi:hypothetical protein
MSFKGFDRKAIALLAKLPSFDENQYRDARDVLATGIRLPGAALIAAVAHAVDPKLVVDRRSSVSPLHRDLRFAAPGTPRYKDHLLLTAWQGADKKVGSPHSAPTALGGQPNELVQVEFPPSPQQQSAAAISASSVSVIPNALRLRRAAVQSHAPQDRPSRTRCPSVHYGHVVVRRSPADPVLATGLPDRDPDAPGGARGSDPGHVLR